MELEYQPRLDQMPDKAPIFPIFLVVLVDVFGFTLVLPLLAIYAETLGATAFQATLLVSVYAACQLFSGPLIGRISDRVGRKPMLLVSQVGTLIGFLILARAPELGASIDSLTHGVLAGGAKHWALWMVYLSRIIDGSTAGNISLAQAYISDNTEPKDRAKSFALIGIAFGLGFLVGPALTGYLAGTVANPHLSRPIYLAAVMSATSILCTAALVRGGAPVHARPVDVAGPGPGGKRLGVLNWGAYLEYFERPALRALLLQFFCYMLCFTLFTSGFALFAERRFKWHGHPFSPREIGFVFAYAGFLGIILQGGLVGRLVKRFGEKRLIVAGFLTLVGGYCFLGGATTIALLLATATITSFGNGVLRPALTSLITQNAGRHEQGVVLGLMQSMTSVAAIISPSVAGMLIERQRLVAWCLAAAVISLVGLVLAIRGRGVEQAVEAGELRGASEPNASGAAEA